MKIGVPKEIKTQEFRVGLTPESAAELIRAGHEVLVETSAGEGSNASDGDYEKVGAKILPSAPAVFEAAELIVKVKEPQPVECEMLTPEEASIPRIMSEALKKLPHITRPSEMLKPGDMAGLEAICEDIAGLASNKATLPPQPVSENQQVLAFD